MNPFCSCVGLHMVDDAVARGGVGLRLDDDMVGLILGIIINVAG